MAAEGRGRGLCVSQEVVCQASYFIDGRPQVLFSVAAGFSLPCLP